MTEEAEGHLQYTVYVYGCVYMLSQYVCLYETLNVWLGLFSSLWVVNVWSASTGLSPPGRGVWFFKCSPWRSVWGRPELWLTDTSVTVRGVQRLSLSEAMQAAVVVLVLLSCVSLFLWFVCVKLLSMDSGEIAGSYWQLLEELKEFCLNFLIYMSI